MQTLLRLVSMNRWLVWGALSVALLASLPEKISAQSTPASDPASHSYLLRAPGEVVGGVLGGAVGLGVGAGITYLMLLPFQEPPTRYNEYDELESGCEWGCYTGERVLIGLFGITLTMATTFYGMGFGVYGAGKAFGGHGSMMWTLVGTGVGAGAQLAVLLMLSTTEPSSDTMLNAAIATSALPILGAVFGFELTHAKWRPELGVSPDGKGAYVGASMHF